MKTILFFFPFLLAVPVFLNAQTNNFVRYINFENPWQLSDYGLLYKDRRPLHYKQEGNFLKPAIVNIKNDNTLVLRVDNNKNGVNKDRSEIAVSSAVYKDRFYYFGFNFFIPKDINLNNDAPWTIITQCPQAEFTNPKASPPISLRIRKDGTLELVTLSDKRKKFWIDHLRDTHIPIQKGKWNRVMLRFRFGDEGNLKLWYNNSVPALNDKYTPIGYKNAADNCNLKFGIYRASASEPLTVAFDNVVFSDSYDEVMSRLTRR